MQALGIVVLVLTGTTAGVVAFVILFGIGFGAITPARAALVAELYGRANYGTHQRDAGALRDRRAGARPGFRWLALRLCSGVMSRSSGS